MAKASIHSTTGGKTRNPAGGEVRGGASDHAVVLTVTMAVAELAPFSTIVPGTTEQLARDGAPLQDRFTLPVNPLLDAKLRV